MVEDLHMVIGQDIVMPTERYMYDRFKTPLSPTIQYSSDIGSMPFQTGACLLPYDAETVHLVTRHHHGIPAKGYFFPLTSSTWLMFGFTIFFTALTLHIGTHFMVGKIDWKDIVPLTLMFHYESSPGLKFIYHFKIGNIM